MGRPPARRWPLEPLLDAAHASSLTAFARAVGVDPREVYRWRAAGGVTTETSDRIAVRLCRNPIELWPDWLDDALARDLADAEARRQRRLARDRRDSALYRERHPERVALYQADYHARPENREAKRRYRRAYYRLNRDDVLAKQRERDRARAARAAA